VNDREPPQVVQFGKVALPREQAQRLSPTALVEVLVAAGTSRVTAHRIVEVARGDEPGRARKHRLDR
jgi:hypothetical protein